MLRQGLKGAVLGLAALALLPAGANAALPDASCPGPPNAMSGNTHIAQTFTAQRTGGIVSGQMFVEKSAGADFVMQILRADAGGPMASPLGSTLIPDSSVPNNTTTAVNGTFAPPVQVTAGGGYAIALIRPGGFIARDRNGNPCPGNEFSFNGSAWTLANPNFDYVFSTMVEPANDVTVKGQQGLTLTVSVPNAGTVSVAGTPQAGGKGASSAKRKGKGKRKPRALIAAAQATALGPGDITVSLALTKAGKKRFKQKGKLSSGVTVTFAPTGGQPKSISATVGLKRKKKKKR